MIKYPKEKKIALDLLAEANVSKIPCPICGNGTFGGTLYHCCDNVFCKLYDPFLMGKKCKKCGDIVRYCAC